MKKKILEALQTKFQGVDAAILERIAAKKAESVTDEAEIPTLVEGISFSDVLQSYGDYRAGDASVKAVATYEKKHNLKDGKTSQAGPTDPPVDPPKPNPEDNDDTLSKFAAVVQAAVKPLQDEITALKSADLNKSLLSTVRENLKDVDESYYQPFLEGRQFSSEDDATAFVTQVQAGWKAFTEKHAAEGLNFTPPGKAGEKGDDIDGLVAAISQGTKEKYENK